MAADGLDDDAAREVLRGRVLLVDGLRRRGLLVEREVRRVARRAERAGRARRRREVRVERVCVCVYSYSSANACSLHFLTTGRHTLVPRSRGITRFEAL